jgi:hypothetical protein
MGCSASSVSFDTTQSLVTIDETNAGAAIKITGRAWVNAAKDAGVTRWNRSRIVRVSNYTSDSIQVLAQCHPGGNGDLAVLVDGALFTTIAVNAVSSTPAWYTVSGMGTASKTIEFWEDFQARLDELNAGVDGAIAATYVLKVRLVGSATITKPTATTGTVFMGDSLLDGSATRPWTYNGWAGQVRRTAHAAGQMTGYVGTGAGTLCGDGLTAAQVASLIHDVWAAIGCTTKKLVYFSRPNDYKYYDFVATATPAQYATFFAAVLDALTVSDAGYTCQLVTPFIPNGTAETGANSGGHTRADYATALAGTAVGRPHVTVRDGSTAFGLVLAASADYAEAAPNQVHLGQSAADGQAGHDKVAPVVAGWLGL